MAGQPEVDQVPLEVLAPVVNVHPNEPGWQRLALVQGPRPGISQQRRDEHILPAGDCCAHVVQQMLTLLREPVEPLPKRGVLITTV